MNFIEDKLTSDNRQAVHAKRPALAKFATTDELKENVPEHQLIEVANDVKVITKAEKKALHGLLSKRNECAHPTGYKPPERSTRIRCGCRRRFNLGPIVTVESEVTGF